MLRADWVFAYGSLIWNPEFAHVEAVRARVNGWHRAFCIASAIYRGTPERPGVVLGLAAGGSVTGMAFRLDPSSLEAALQGIYEREMALRVYRPKLLDARLTDGRRVRALGFVADPVSPYFLRLDEDQVLERLACCEGRRGPNHEYATQTLQALHGMGVRDRRLARLVARLEALLDARASEERLAKP